MRLPAVLKTSCLPLALLGACAHVPPPPIPKSCHVATNATDATYTCTKSAVVDGVAVSATVVSVVARPGVAGSQWPRRTPTIQFTANGQIVTPTLAADPKVQAALKRFIASWMAHQP
jgi:hypothetical protein